MEKGLSGSIYYMNRSISELSKVKLGNRGFHEPLSMTKLKIHLGKKTKTKNNEVKACLEIKASKQSKA